MNKFKPILCCVKREDSFGELSHWLTVQAWDGRIEEFTCYDLTQLNEDEGLLKGGRFTYFYPDDDLDMVCIKTVLTEKKAIDLFGWIGGNIVNNWNIELYAVCSFGVPCEFKFSDKDEGAFFKLTWS